MSESETPKASILTVDDKPDNLRLIADLLQGRGYKIRPALSGEVAVKSAKTTLPDIVLMDVNMPEMDGYEACRKLKEIPGFEDIPVIYVSALSSIADKVNAFENGGVDYVTKPFNVEELEARIETHLNLTRLKKEAVENYKKLKDLEELRDRLVHMVAHDLRNPLSVITAALEFVKMDDLMPELEESCQKMVKAAAEQSELMNNMISDLLDVSRMEDSKLPLSKEVCDLGKVLAEACAGVASNERNIIPQIQAGNSQANCDPKLIKRVIGNLLNNAVKYTPSGGDVHITVLDPVDGEIRLEVKDSGPGIPPEYHDRVFEKFVQVEGDETAKKVPSTGLGLSFCQMAVEAHGGKIGVESTPGEGATFWFTLPK